MDDEAVFRVIPFDPGPTPTDQDMNAYVSWTGEISPPTDYAGIIALAVAVVAAAGIMLVRQERARFVLAAIVGASVVVAGATLTRPADDYAAVRAAMEGPLTALGYEGLPEDPGLHEGAPIPSDLLDQNGPVTFFAQPEGSRVMQSCTLTLAEGTEHTLSCPDPAELSGTPT